MTALDSLKSIIPDLAPLFGMTPAALYERQRALVRAKLMKVESGRGPGSGVKATPQSIALLLISVLATDSLSEVESATKVLARLKCLDGPCGKTGKKIFATALAALLASPELSAETFKIRVFRGENYVQIYFKDKTGSVTGSVFETRYNPISLLRIEASLVPYPLLQIAKLMNERLSDPFSSYSKEELELILGEDREEIMDRDQGI